MLDALVTPNFALSEFVVSDTAARLGIDNTPPAMVEANLRNVLIPAMQQIRDLLMFPVMIKSGYRSPKLNAAVRGASASDHVTGHAADFVCPAYGSPRAVCERLLELQHRIKFDQLINEGGGWIHVSFSPRRRNEVLTAHFGQDGRVRYTQGL